MIEATVTEFAKHFERYEEEAQDEPVTITSNGQVSGYFVSAREYAELDRLRAFERKIYRLERLPPEIADLIEAARMEPAHDHLNEFLGDD